MIPFLLWDKCWCHRNWATARALKQLSETRRFTENSCQKWKARNVMTSSHACWSTHILVKENF